MTNYKKYIKYFKISFILIIIFFIIYKLTTALLSSPPSPKKDTTPVIIPTWEDCFDRLNSNPLVKDIRWDEKTKVCSVLQSVNTDNTNPNTISDSLKKCPGVCPLYQSDNDKICSPQGEIIPRPVYWELIQGTGECTKSISCTLGDQNHCYETEDKCKDKKRPCPNNCSGAGDCNYYNGVCTCNPGGTKRADCTDDGDGTCECKLLTSDGSPTCINKCNGPRHMSPTLIGNNEVACKCDLNR